MTFDSGAPSGAMFMPMRQNVAEKEEKATKRGILGQTRSCQTVEAVMCAFQTAL